ncbi:hypothetical protein [Actinomyces gaoshouyii]|nr:hypothetical protein [Actinomyces gaoshouyii]
MRSAQSPQDPSSAEERGCLTWRSKVGYGSGGVAGDVVVRIIAVVGRCR